MSAQIRCEVETTLPTLHGDFRVRAYLDVETGDEHLALIAPGQDAENSNTVPLVRLHSECLTGEALGSLRCECGPQLRTALETVSRDGGVVLYLRGQEGRGIGLLNKLRAYRLQDQGYDTVDANLELGLPADARDYSAAAAILHELGMPRVRLLTNNPLKERALTEHGVSVTERVPLEVGRNAVNEGYLRTKALRMGHFLHLDPPGYSGETPRLQG